MIKIDTLGSDPGMRLSGDGWDALDAYSKALMGRLSRTSLVSRLWAKSSQLFDGVGILSERFVFRPDDVSVEGLLPNRNVVRAADAQESFSSSSHANAHSLDGNVVWSDEDGGFVTHLGAAVLLPQPGALVTNAMRTATQTWFVLKFKKACSVHSITTENDSFLLAGVDFMQAFDRLFFREHPCAMFPTGEFWYSASASNPSPRSSITGVDAATDATAALTRLRREVPTAARIEDAVNDTLGVTVLPRGGELIEVVELPRGYRYSFDWGDVLCQYEHTPLTVGTSYAAGYRVGARVRLHERGQQGESWWQGLDWTHPVDLRWLCPAAPHLKAFNQPVRAEGYAVGADTFVRFHLDGPPGELEKYWNWCAAAELAGGRQRMSARLSLADGAATSVDWLALLFEMLGRRAVVVDITGPPSVAWDLVRRNAPTTAVLLPRFLP